MWEHWEEYLLLCVICLCNYLGTAISRYILATFCGICLAGHEGQICFGSSKNLPGEGRNPKPFKEFVRTGMRVWKHLSLSFPKEEGNEVILLF